MSNEKAPVYKKMLLNKRPMDAYSRHKMLMNIYQNEKIMSNSNVNDNKNIKGLDNNSSKTIKKTDLDYLREYYQLIPDENEINQDNEYGKELDIEIHSNQKRENTWQMRMAKIYHDQLIKEYCLADFTRITTKTNGEEGGMIPIPKSNNDNKNQNNKKEIGLRWRSEQEVISGKGQFICANLKCKEMDGLTSWELDFVYNEQERMKRALVKCRLCHSCSRIINAKNKYSSTVDDEFFP